MAQWVRRARAGGGESVQIKWRQDGRWQCETFSDPKTAVQFRTAVEVAGNVWPLDWVKGEGWAQPAMEPVPEPVRVAVEDVATGPDGYFAGQEKRKRRGKIKPYTLHRDRRTYELHLRGAFGQVGFVDLDEDQISDWIDEQFDAGASAKSIRNRHGLLSSILKHGQERMKLRPDNPCALSELPELDTATSQARQIRFFQHGEWALFRSCVKSDAHLLLDLELSTGIRWGEISALRVEDVTFDGRDDERQANLHIVRAWSQRSPDDTSPVRWNEAENRSWVLGPPKNGRARWVVVTGEVAARLEQAIAGRAEGSSVFQTRHGNPWRYPDFYTDRWAPARRLAARHGLTRSVTPHMLRHTTVVWSLAEGVPIQVVSEMIGHSSLQMTYDVYGGLINLRDPVMAQAMARAMLISRHAVLPRVLPDDVNRPQRPGRRGESRRRAS